MLNKAGYLVETETGFLNSVGDAISSIVKLGTESGSDEAVIKPNTELSSSLMKLAIKYDIAKYWVEVELPSKKGAKYASRVWVSQKYIEPCRFDNKSELTDQDVEMNSADRKFKFLNSNDKVYYASLNQDMVKYKGKKMTRFEYLRDKYKNDDSYQFIDDISLHATRDSERIRFLPKIEFKLPG
jgi:hypothetical protein